MYENFIYVMEYDFVNTAAGEGTNFGLKPGQDRITSVSNTPAIGTPVPLDLWVAFRNIPYIGHIRVGNQKEPMGFERLMSSRFLNFMERSFNQDAFYAPYDNGFVPGIMTYSTYADRRGTYALGVFKNQTNGYAYDVGGGNYKVTGRVTRPAPLQGRGQEGDAPGRLGPRERLRQRPATVPGPRPRRAGLSSIWPLYANTGVFNGSGGQQDLNLESVNVFGPWTIDAEYNFHWSQNAFLAGKPSVGTLFYSGGYVEVLYFLTGEHRAYIKRVGPLRPDRAPQERLLGRGEEGRAERARVRGLAGRRPLQLLEPQRQGDQRRGPERHHHGPQLVHQPEHEVPVELQRHRPPFADRPERRHDPGLRHAVRHGLLSRRTRQAEPVGDSTDRSRLAMTDDSGRDARHQPPLRQPRAPNRVGGPFWL